MFQVSKASMNVCMLMDLLSSSGSRDTINVNDDHEPNVVGISQGVPRIARLTGALHIL